MDTTWMLPRTLGANPASLRLSRHEPTVVPLSFSGISQLLAWLMRPSLIGRLTLTRVSLILSFILQVFTKPCKDPCGVTSWQHRPDGQKLICAGVPKHRILATDQELAALDKDAASFLVLISGSAIRQLNVWIKAAKCSLSKSYR